MRTSLPTSAIAAAALVALACSNTSPSPSPQIVIESAQNGPLTAGLNDAVATVPVGVALSIQVEPYDSTVTGTISVTSDDPAVATLVPTTAGDTYLIVGMAPGATSLHCFIDGNETTALATPDGATASSVEVDVTAQ
jgi:hypothetical protein